jgi:predicted transcriptional regulator
LDARALELCHDLVQRRSYIDFSERLTSKALEALYYFDQPRTVSEIIHGSDNYRNTVDRALSRFRDRGLAEAGDDYMSSTPALR